jgi:hypothetical protein
MNRWLGDIGFGGVALLQVVIVVLLLKFRGGYKRGRHDGFNEGIEAGRIRADDWWLETIHQVDQAAHEIREEDRWP